MCRDCYISICLPMTLIHFCQTTILAELNTANQELSNWFSANRLTVNISKSNFIKFRSKQMKHSSPLPCLKLNGKIIFTSQLYNIFRDIYWWTFRVEKHIYYLSWTSNYPRLVVIYPNLNISFPKNYFYCYTIH